MKWVDRGFAELRILRGAIICHAMMYTYDVYTVCAHLDRQGVRQRLEYGKKYTEAPPQFEKKNPMTPPQHPSRAICETDTYRYRAAYIHVGTNTILSWAYKYRIHVVLCIAGMVGIRVARV